MPLRDFTTVPYLPILGLKPAEMRALEELPDLTKDEMLPVLPLRPWVGSHRLESSLERITVSYGDRPVLIEVGEREVAKDRPVFAELEELRDPRRGFDNWCAFIEEHDNYIPVAQIGIDPSHEQRQVERLHHLGRGLCVRIEREAFGQISLLSQNFAAVTAGGQNVIFIIDYCAVKADHLLVAAQTASFITTIRSFAPYASIAISASSFPSQFSGLPAQEIFERRLYNEVRGRNGVAPLVYSDRGSSRVEALGGGGGVIPARIDYPGFDDWTFFRSDESGLAGYIEQARILMRTTLWNGDLRVWGTQMIERTARGDASAIDSPQKSTAARINLHLQLQTFYDNRGAVSETEDDWED